MKIVRKLVVALSVVVLLVVVGVVLAFVYIDRIAKTGIEKGGTYALGVNTSVDSVSVGILSGKFGLTGLKVANPAGFKSAEFMSLGTAGVEVNPSSLQKPVIELPVLSLSNIRLDLEKSGGKSNYQSILDNLAKLQSQSSQKKASSSETKFIVKELTITDIKVHADLLGIGGDLTALDIPIDRISVKNIGNDGSGVDAGELTGVVVRAVIAAAVEKGGKDFPGDVAGELTSQLGKIGNLGDMSVQAAGQVTKIGKDVTKAVEGATKEAEKAVDSVKKGLDGLIPGKKK